MLKVRMSESEGARANLQHRMLILTADRLMATHVGYVCDPLKSLLCSGSSVICGDLV